MDEAFVSAQLGQGIGLRPGLTRRDLLERRVLELESEVAGLPALVRQVVELKAEVASLKSEVRSAREAAAERQAFFEASEERFAHIREAIGESPAEGQDDEPLDAETLNMLLGRGPEE